MWFCDFGKKFEYSIRYAHGNMKSTLPLLKQRQQKYFAVSDYCQISCWPSQYFKCKENNIIPILGMQTFLNNYKLQEEQGKYYIQKKNEWKKPLEEISDEQKNESTIDYSLSIYARTLQGYYNIIQIHNDAQINGYDKKPKTNDYTLRQHGKGVVCLLNTPYNDVTSYIYNGFDKQALQRYKFYQEVFDDVYITIPILQNEDYKQLNDLIIAFCQKHNIKMLPVINSHYNYRQDYEVFKTFRKISKIRSGVNYDVDISEGQYYKTMQEVKNTWLFYLQTDIFTEKVFNELINNYETLLSTFSLLQLDTSVKLPKIKNGEKVLREKSFKGLRDKALDDKPEYIKRLQYELQSVVIAGFADYFLFLQDLYRWYREQRKRFPAAGRGSAGGSLVLYLLGVQNIDPIKYNLLFERFIDIAMFKEKIQKGIPFTGDDCPDVDCFTLDTLVLTPEGPKQIGKLHVGDEVVTRQNSIKKITNEIVHNHCPVVRICYGDWYVDTTYNHKFLIKRNDKLFYEYVMNIQQNDLLVQNDNVFHKIIGVFDKSYELKKVKDIEIEDLHSFRICGKAYNKVQLKDGTIMFLSDKQKNTKEVIHNAGIIVHNCDFPGNEKDNVREYFIKKYGKNNVCHIGTIGYLKLRGALKELARLYEVPLEEINNLTTQGLKDFEPQDQGLPIEQLKSKYYELKLFLQKYPEFEKVFDKLYGTINCWGIHAGGMIVTDFDLTKQLPVRVTDGKLVSCWTEGISGRQLGQMGFIKMDILAIDALDTIQRTIRMVNERHGQTYDLYNIPINEKESLDQLNKHDNIGIFQFDTNLSNRVVDNMGGITCFEDLGILNSLMRPSALINGFDKQMGQLRKNEEQIYIPRQLIGTMSQTQGMPIFQQAAYFYARDLANFDNINSRKFMKTLYKGKMIGDKVPYWKQKFLKGCKDKVKRDVIEVQLQDGTIKEYQLDELIQCKDGQFRTIQSIIQNGYQIK